MKTLPIPSFPAFRLVNLQDQYQIQNFQKKFNPYSDFNFVSMWSYNTEKDLMMSQLNGNLVFLMRDYIDESLSITYLGKSQPVQTINSLLDYAKSNLTKPVLNLIPGLNISQVKKIIKSDFHLLADRSNFDYILSISKLADLQGHDFANKRNKVVHFKKDYPSSTCQIIDLTDSTVQHQLLQVFNRWSESRQRKDVKHEYKAIKTLLHDVRHFNLICFGVFIDEKLEAFSINELLPKKFAITHFTKADPAKTGVFEFLYHEMAKELKSRGALYLNREQDLGLEGLRAGKLSWRPIKFLKKYTISYLVKK